MPTVHAVALCRQTFYDRPCHSSAQTNATAADSGSIGRRRAGSSHSNKSKCIMPQKVSQKGRAVAGKQRSPELSLKGKGVERVSIPAIDRLADAYVTERDKRLKLTPREVAAKTKLIDALRQHSNRLQQPDGTLLYNYDETIIRLEHGKDKLKVEAATHDEE